MTTLVQNIRRLKPFYGLVGQRRFPQGFGAGIGKRGLVVAAMVVLASVVPQGWELTFNALSDAYLAVAVFVAGTLTLVFAVERAFKADLGLWLNRHQAWQVPVATALGAFPGCGGAIIAVTQFTRGYLSFGAVVAALTATMGDAMFLLLAREPDTAGLVLGISAVMGVVSGYVIDAIHKPDFMRPKQTSGGIDTVSEKAVRSTDSEPVAMRSSLTGVERVWVVLMIPGLAVGVFAAFQIDIDEMTAAFVEFAPGHWLGVIGAVLALAMWASRGEQIDSAANDDVTCVADACVKDEAPFMRSVIDTTNFVSAWVIFAFVAYELVMAVSGVDLPSVFAVWAPLVPALAILVGLIPGCGPQIMVTSLYLSGAVPLSAQIGNALANDGDALFPALAIAPKAALMATVYSAIPAILVAYGWYGWVEM